MTDSLAGGRGNFKRNLIFIETAGIQIPLKRQSDRSSENRSYDLPNNITARITGK